MDPEVSVSGQAGSDWSIYRFQAIERDSIQSYTKDYRFAPIDTDVRGYIYVRDADVHTFYEGPVINL